MALQSFAQQSAEEYRKKTSRELLSKGEYDLVIKWLEPFLDRKDCIPSDYSHLIGAYMLKEDYFNALAYSNKWLDVSMEVGDTVSLLKASRYKTSFLYQLEDLEGSIASAKFSLKHYKPTDTIGLTLTKLHLGLFQHDKKDFQLAYDTYSKIKYENVVLAEAESEYFNNFGIIYAKLGMLDSAIYCQNQSLKNKSEIDGEYSRSLNYSNIAAICIDAKEYKLAITYLDSTKLVNADRKHHVFELVYENYFEAYNGMGIADSALFYVHKLKELNQALFLEKMDLEMHELENNYKKEADLKTKILLSNEKLEKSNLQLVLLIIIILLIVIIAGGAILLLRYKNLKASRDNLLTTQRLLRSQITPHFLYNSLSTIQGMILSEENKTAATYLSKFSRLVRLILKNSRDKVVSLSDELEAIKFYIDLQNARFNEMIDYSIRLGEDVKSENIYIPPMLIQPFVENCIEHGFKNINGNGLIDIHIYFKNKSLVCIITDNGIGVDSTPNETILPKKESISTAITMERMTLLAKEFKMTGSLEICDRKKNNEQGTIVTMKIPYKND